MKIAEFDAKVRIGTFVYYGKHRKKVEDIRRRQHEAWLEGMGWVRCSEFYLRKKECVEVKRKYSALNSKRVVVTFPDGSRERFGSASEAADKLGMCVATVSHCCRSGCKTRSGLLMVYENTPDGE